jgi:hypothetical protein
MSQQFNAFGDNNQQAGFSMPGQAAAPVGFTAGAALQTNGTPALQTIHPFAADVAGLSNGPQFDLSMTSGVPKATDLGNGAIRSVRVTSCNFCEMVEQASMGFRPFVSNVTNSQVLEQIPQFVREQRAGANFKAESLNSIVNDIVGLSANTLGQIPIVNGWNIKRYSFTIMAEVVRNNGNVQQYMIEGFTDTPELSIATGGVHVDPNMVLYVNNVVSFAQRSNLINGALSMTPVENYNVISQDPFHQGALIKDFVTQRPYDVANMNLGGVLVGNASSQVIDARSSIATDPKTSSLNNNNPASYVAKIINDGISAMGSTNTDNLFNSTSMRQMIDTVAEPTLARNGFLQALGKIARDFNTAISSFTWKDLVSLDHALSNPHCPYLNVYPLLNRASFLPGSAFMCDDISGSGNEQVFAQMIANGIADIMSRCEATEVSVMATNHSGMDDVEVTGMRCYDQNKLAINVDMFRQLFKANIMQMVNINTQFSYNVAVNASLWGETFVRINLGYGTHTFLLPNFANSMYSPMLTNNKAGTVDVSRHLLSVANTINNEQYKMKDDLNMNFPQSAI